MPQSPGRRLPPRGRVVALLAAGALLAAAGCSSDSDSSSGGDGLTKVHMAIGGITAMPTLPAQIAVAKGYFKDEGIDATIDDVKAGSKTLQATLAGQVEVGIGFYEHTLQSAAKGKEIRSFVEFTTMPGYALVVSPKYKDKIRSVADLKGQAVGVSAPGSATDFFLKYLLGKAGLPPDSARPVGLGTGASPIATFEKGDVAAAVLYDPMITQLLTNNPDATVLADARDPGKAKELFGASSYPSMTLYAKAEWLAENGDTARKLATAIRKADQYLHSASVDEITGVLSKETVGTDVARFKKVLAASIPYISTDGTIDSEGAAAVAAVLATTQPDVAAAKLDPAKYYTNEYLSAG